MCSFEEYVTPTKKDKLIAVAVGIVFLIVGTVCLVQKKYILMAAMYLGGLAVIIGALTAASQLNKLIEELRRSNQYDAVVKDFQNAAASPEESVVFGEQYIFREKLPELLRYEEIAEARYLERLDSGNGHDHHMAHRVERLIVIKLTNGKSRTLCRLQRADYMQAASDILFRLQLKNPSITIIE